MDFLKDFSANLKNTIFSAFDNLCVFEKCANLKGIRAKFYAKLR